MSINIYSIQYLLSPKANILIGKEIELSAWVRTKRGNKHVAFIALNDGTCMQNLQVVADMTSFSEEDLKDVTTGSSVCIKGTLVESQGKGQSLEVQAKSIEVLGMADPETYPLQKKGHSLEFLREIAHLRPRTNTFGAVFRIRHHMSYAVHKFFNDEGFFNLHTPIITASDAEGAGEMFRVSTFEPNKAPLADDGSIDYSKDFFGRETNLTVSGQLEGELGALALGKIYTFGPTFRAENSNTTRHLAEFWMIEPEMAFHELEDNMNLAEKMLSYLIRYALEHCKEDLEFLNSMYDNTLLERLEAVSSTPFERITYTQAVDILKASGKKFEYKVDWGTDLQSEHERYLVEQHFKKPVILTHYPKEIKAFYMKLAEDGKTVKAMDILFPGIGEIVGGSERENDLDLLLGRMKEVGIHEKDLWWYLDTRRFGSVPHAGFGLGFERLLLFVTGMQNIRDVIPFPRFPKFADF